MTHPNLLAIEHDFSAPPGFVFTLWSNPALVSGWWGPEHHHLTTCEIDFRPGLVLMHDTTSTPPLVDLSAMRSTQAEAGIDPNDLNTSLPVDLSDHHTQAVEAIARSDPHELNMEY